MMGREDLGAPSLLVVAEGAMLQFGIFNEMMLCGVRLLNEAGSDQRDVVSPVVLTLSISGILPGVGGEVSVRAELIR